MLLLLSCFIASDSVQPQRRQPIRLPRPWNSSGNNTGVGCHFLLQCRKVKSESEVAQSCQTVCDPTDCRLPGSSIRGIFQARVLEWGAIAFSDICIYLYIKQGKFGEKNFFYFSDARVARTLDVIRLPILMHLQKIQTQKVRSSSCFICWHHQQNCSRVLACLKAVSPRELPE